MAEVDIKKLKEDLKSARKAVNTAKANYKAIIRDDFENDEAYEEALSKAEATVKRAEGKVKAIRKRLDDAHVSWLKSTFNKTWKWALFALTASGLIALAYYLYDKFGGDVEAIDEDVAEADTV